MFLITWYIPLLHFINTLSHKYVIYDEISTVNCGFEKQIKFVMVMLPFYLVGTSNVLKQLL